MFHDFHHEIAQRLLATGQLRMSWVDVDGCTVVAEYQYVGPTTNYSYQSGVDPDRLDVSPGHIGNFYAIGRELTRGRRYFDFLRGDEPYKTFSRRRHTRCAIALSIPIATLPGCFAAALGLLRPRSRIR